MKKMIAMCLSVSLIMFFNVLPVTAESSDRAFDELFEVKSFEFSEPSPIESKNLLDLEENSDQPQFTDIIETFDLPIGQVPPEGDMEDAGSFEQQMQPRANGADLWLQDFLPNQRDYTSPYPAEIGLPFKVSVVNSGNVAAYNIELSIKIDNNNPVSSPIGNLNSMQGTTIGFTLPPLIAGTRNILLTVNASHSVPETNYNNNTLSVPLQFIPRVELMSISIDTVSGIKTLKTGVEVNFRLKFANAGSMDAKNVPVELVGSFRTPDGLTTSGTMGYVNTIPNLPSHQSMTADTTIIFEKVADLKMGFIMDGNNTLNDLDRSNNSAYENFTIQSSKTKFALSVGSNNPELGNLNGDFTGNVSYANIAYKSINGLEAEANLIPDVDYLTSINSASGRKKLTADVQFFNGHANYNNIVFPSMIYKTGIYITDSERWTSTSGFEYAGIVPSNYTNVDLVSYVGCDTNTFATGQGYNNICTKTVLSGAQTVLGFSSKIISRFEQGPSWLQEYNNALSRGETVSQAVESASRKYGQSDLGLYANVLGDPDNTITDIPASRNIDHLNLLNSEITFQMNSVSTDQNGDKLSSHSDSYSNIISEIQSFDPEFDPDNYVVWVNPYAINDQNRGIIKFYYWINGKIKTSKDYTTIILNNAVTDISSSNSIQTFSYQPKEKDLLQRISNFESTHPTTYADSELELTDNQEIAEQSQEYTYDYTTDELSLVKKYIIVHHDEDDALSVEVVKTLIP